MIEHQPIFEANTIPVLEDVFKTFTQRGGEYSDTWRNCRWLAMDATLDLIGPKDSYSADEQRAIGAAVHVDIKYSRFEGPYKEDTAIDLIAYLANWVGQMRKLEALRKTE